MSVALDLVVRVREPRTSAELLAALRDAVEGHPAWSGEWQAARTGLRGWRYLVPPPAEAGVHPLWITAGDPTEFPGAERTRGACSLTFPAVWPFYDDGADSGRATRPAVVDNTRLILDLIERLVAAVHPASVRVHTDDGPPLPFNAHLAYYADHVAVLGDLQWIAELWQRGDAPWHLEPLRDIPPHGKHWATHEWRTAGATTDLLRRLEPLVAAVPAIGEPQVHDVLQAGTCRHRRLGTTGFLVLNDGPGVAPGFIDRFYTESAEVL